MKEIGIFKETIEFSTAVKISQVAIPKGSKVEKFYVTFKTAFTNEQEVELVSMFGDNEGTEIYEKAKKRLSITPDNVSSLGQEISLKLSNSDSEQNTAYITILYSAE